MYLGLRQNGTHTAEGEDAGPLCIWVSDRMVPILLRVRMLVLCPSGHVKAKEVGIHLGFSVGDGASPFCSWLDILNLFAKPFFGGRVCVTP